MHVFRRRFGTSKKVKAFKCRNIYSLNTYMVYIKIFHIQIIFTRVLPCRSFYVVVHITCRVRFGDNTFLISYFCILHCSHRPEFRFHWLKYTTNILTFSYYYLNTKSLTAEPCPWRVGELFAFSTIL